ncbi:MAG TPA: DUF4926 domain-containing protein [Verrucomicrobiae bacterium]|jgi:hypothetical protein
MINELDSIVLTCDLPEEGLSAGDIGTVVLVHRAQAGYEVEFLSLNGDTIAVVTLLPNQVRSVQSGEIAHARSLAVA